MSTYFILILVLGSKDAKVTGHSPDLKDLMVLEGGDRKVHIVENL